MEKKCYITMLVKIIRVSSWGGFQWREPSKANRIRQGGVMFRDWGAVQLGHSMQKFFGNRL